MKLPTPKYLVPCFLLLAHLCVGFTLPAGKDNGKGFHRPNQFNKNFVAVTGSLYACKYETSNADYGLFLQDLRGRMQYSIYQSMLPDTARWLDIGSENPEFYTHYLSHPKYANYPVVNVSYEQANFYCNWLTQKYMRNPNRQFKKVIFKLPSRSEWQQTMCNGDMTLKYPWGTALDTIPPGILVNFNPDSKRKALPMPVNQKKAMQGKNGIYHAIGNVSEMVSSKGDCIGGNYRSWPEWSRIDAPNEFEPGYLPCPLIGFRVFMLVLEP